jgi:hypothetical protein
LKCLTTIFVTNVQISALSVTCSHALNTISLAIELLKAHFGVLKIIYCHDGA